MMLRWLWLSGLVVGLDQMTKYLAESLLRYHEPVAVVPYFNLTLMYNTGAAFSFLSDAGGWQRWFLSAVAIVVSGVLIVWLNRVQANERWTAAALALVIGGAIGNVIDRLVYGQVVDFIDIYYRQWSWPAFNVADSAIFVGVAILLIDALFARREESES